MIAGAATTSAAPVFRFYNTKTQMRVYAISAEDRNQLLARYAQLVVEGPVLYAFTQAQGDAQPVFRLFDTATGTHRGRCPFWTQQPVFHGL